MRRPWLVAVGSLVAIMIVAVVTLSLSPVQTSIARKMLPVKPGQAISFNQLSVSLNRIQIEGLQVVDGPVTLKVPSIDAAVSVWGLINGAVRIQRLDAKGWTVIWAGEEDSADVAEIMAAPNRVVSAGWGALLAVASGEAGADVLPVETLASWLQLPVKLDVDGLDLTGYVEWRNAGPGEDGHAHVSISGGGIRVGQKSAISVMVKAESSGGGGGGIQSLNITADLGIELATSDQIEGVWIESQLHGKRDENAKFDVYDFDFGFDASGDVPRLTFSLANESQPLFSSEIDAGKGELGLTGDWRLSLTDESVSNLMLGTALPQFALSGSGKVRSGYEFSNLELEGALEFEADNLAVVEPKAGAIGRLAGELKFAGKRLGEDLRVTQWELDLRGAAPVMQVKLLQGVEFALAGLEVRVKQPSDPVLVLDLQGLPLNWLQPWMTPWTLDGRPVNGKIVAMATAGGLRLVTSEALRSSGLVLAKEGTTLVDNLNLAVDFGTEITQDGWQIEIGRMEISDAEGVWVDISARGGQLIEDESVLKVAGRLEMNLTALDRVPQFRGRSGLRSGRLESEFAVGLSDRVALALGAELSGLVTNDGEVLPELQIDGRLDLLADGSIEIHLPMQFSREGRLSELTLNARVNPIAAGWELAGSLSGPRAYLADVQLLGAGLAQQPSVDDGDADSTPKSDEKQGPVWQGIGGKFETAIGVLELPNGLILKDVRGDLVITPEGIGLSEVQVGVGERGKIDLQAAIRYDSDGNTGYVATARITADEVEAGPLLRVFEVNPPLPFEGRVSLEADWKSSAKALEGLIEASGLEANLTSSGGVLRVLGVEVDQYIKTGKTVAALGGLLALATGDSRAQHYVGRAQALTEVAEQLSALAFDQLNLKLKRMPAGDIELSEISLISPKVRLLGNGRISYRPGVPVWSQPLAVQMRFAARDQLAENLRVLKLLNAEADSLGYIPLIRDISLDGSLANVGTAELQRLLSRAIAGP